MDICSPMKRRNRTNAACRAVIARTAMPDPWNGTSRIPIRIFWPAYMKAVMKTGRNSCRTQPVWRPKMRRTVMISPLIQWRAIRLARSTIPTPAGLPVDLVDEQPTRRWSEVLLFVCADFVRSLALTKRNVLNATSAREPSRMARLWMDTCVYTVDSMR